MIHAQRWMVAALLSISTGPVFAQAGGWHKNVDEAAAIAKKSGKPLMVVFRCER